MRAEQDRAARARARHEQEKAAGTNVHVPLDEWRVINVGGESVTVKLHDNDVASFDVWLQGQRRHQVQKQKGITGTGSDETLIYANTRAALYYVWEISGELNHCLLRIRDL
jgi:hypothetical protein